MKYLPYHDLLGFQEFLSVNQTQHVHARGKLIEMDQGLLTKQIVGVEHTTQHVHQLYLTFALNHPAVAVEVGEDVLCK